MSETTVPTEVLPGETINVALTNAVLSYSTDEFLYLIVPGFTSFVCVPAGSVQIERVKPADGVPQVGEEWVDRNGTFYFVATSKDGPYFLRRDGDSVLWQRANQLWGPLRRVREATTFTPEEVAPLKLVGVHLDGAADYLPDLTEAVAHDDLQPGDTYDRGDLEDARPVSPAVPVADHIITGYPLGGRQS